MKANLRLRTTLGALGLLMLPALGVMAAPAATPEPAAPAGTAINAQDPTQLIQDVASSILKELESNRAAYVNNPNNVRALADKYLLPYFDTRYAAQLVLGKYWRSATEDQRTRFIKAFQD